jgi:hypothetical protein
VVLGFYSHSPCKQQNYNLLYHAAHEQHQPLVSTQAHDVASISDVNIQFFDGVVKNIPQILYFPTIKKNFLSLGFIFDQNHNIEFFFKRLLCVKPLY